MALLVSENIVVFDPSPRQVFVEPALDIIFQPGVCIAEFNVNPAARQSGVGRGLIGLSLEIVPCQLTPRVPLYQV